MHCFKSSVSRLYHEMGADEHTRVFYLVSTADDHYHTILVDFDSHAACESFEHELTNCTMFASLDALSNLDSFLSSMSGTETIDFKTIGTHQSIFRNCCLTKQEMQSLLTMDAYKFGDQ